MIFIFSLMCTVFDVIQCRSNVLITVIRINFVIKYFMLEIFVLYFRSFHIFCICIYIHCMVNNFRVKKKTNIFLNLPLDDNIRKKS